MALAAAFPTVAFEDNHLLICVKPAGMPVQGDETRDTSLVDWGKTYLETTYNKPGAAFIGLVHRIDRPVSGLVMLAKTSKALSRLTQAVADRTILKRYYAEVEHIPDLPSDLLVDYLQKNSTNNTTKRVSPKHPHGKRAELTYHILSTEADRALLGIDLKTGRHHQIRVQLGVRGWPIVGDLKYGAHNTPHPNAIRLHAGYLGFTHPVSNVYTHIEALPTWAPNATGLQNLGYISA